MSDSRLVFSTDPKFNQKCSRCKELISECTCAKEPDTGKKFIAVLRIEKAGRGGKTVTIADGLPKVEIFLKDWTKKLKNRCGTGGTYRLDGKEGLIEIQGDRREEIRQFFTTMGVRTKG